jgi:hypothetical protein
VKAAEWDEVLRFCILKSLQAMGHETVLDPPAHRIQRDERGTASGVNRDFGDWATRQWQRQEQGWL